MIFAGKPPFAGAACGHTAGAKYKISTLKIVVLKNPEFFCKKVLTNLRGGGKV
jgi:hypothetical protein